MRESIGSTMLINIIIVFITLVFVFITSTLIYHKAFKVTKSISSIIEKYEGYNDYARQEINQSLGSIGYSVEAQGKCPASKKASNGTTSDLFVKDEATKKLYDSRYCIYHYPNDEGNYRIYGIITYVTIDFPIFDRLYIPIYVETNRIYKLG